MQIMIDNHEECPMRGCNGQCKVADQDSELHMTGGCRVRACDGWWPDPNVPPECPMHEHDVVISLADKGVRRG